MGLTPCKAVKRERNAAAGRYTVWMILAPSPWWTALPSAAAALGYAWLAWHGWRHPARPGPDGVAVRQPAWAMALVWALHLLALGLALGQSPARFGFAPALSVTAWLVLTVYTLETHLYPQFRVHWAFAGLGTVAVLLALAFPGAIYLHLGSAWLPLHWALGIASYGLLGAAVLHAWMMQRAEQAMRSGRGTPALPLLALERLTFRLVMAAFVLLTLTVVAGWWFTHLLAPQGWGWTHKTVFTVLSWAVLGTLLWGRLRWGWRGRLAVRLLYGAAVLLLLGYVGSRFVLEVVLQRA